MTESLSDAQIQHQLDISHHLVFIPFTILLYDYVLTFDQEVARYWGTKQLTWGTLLFYVNRYSALFGTIPVFVEYLLTTVGAEPSKRHEICKGLQSYHQYFALLSQVLAAIILITRTYALYQRDNRVLVLMIVVTLAAFVFALYILLAGTSPDTDTLSSLLQTLGCPSASTRSTNRREAAAWSGMLVFDVMIFSLTVYKSSKYATRDRSLFGLLFRDGALYFGLMVVSNACNIGTYTMGGPLISGSAATLTNTISSVMISRLMLNLRDPNIRLTQRNRSSRATTTQDSPAITTLMTPYTDTDIALDSAWYELSHRSLEDGQDRDACNDRNTPNG